jgi:hypothetical protein
MWVRVYAPSPIVDVDRRGIISKNKLWIKNPLNCTWNLKWNGEIESDWIIEFDGIINLLDRIDHI